MPMATQPHHTWNSHLCTSKTVNDLWVERLIINTVFKGLTILKGGVLRDSSAHIKYLKDKSETVKCPHVR